MFELICHHHYTWDGLPADKSPYRNHGTATNTDGSSDGSEPGSGVIKFPQPNSRVRIATGPAWQRLIALQIEVLVRVDPQAKPLAMLVAGHGSFRFGLSEGALAAEFVNAGGIHNFVRSADDYSPDHRYHPVPANRWVKLGLHHDGFARMRLFIEDELVGEAIIEGGIPPVQSLGVSIGNDVDQDDRHFPGEIDELRIWRLDPKAIKREFLRRPLTHETARCWQTFIEEFLAWTRRNPERYKSLVHQVRAAHNSFIRSLFLLPPNDQAKLRATLVSFGDLWFAGRISGPEMKQVICDWIGLLHSHGIDPEDDPATDSLRAAFAEVGIDARTLLECDPKFALLLGLLSNAAAHCGRKGVRDEH